MRKSTSLFLLMTDPNFLFYSWKELKKKKIKFSSFLKLDRFNPVGRLWFEKISYQLRENCFDYEKNFFISFNKHGLKKYVSLSSSFQIRIIENAIISIVQPYFSIYFFHNIHDSLYFLKNWSTNILYFLTCRILKSFSLLNKNRLKNIFCRVISDPKIWLEIEKMILANIIDFSENHLYKSLTFDSSLLSSFLFDLYFIEFDFFISQILFLLNSRKTFYLVNSFGLKRKYKFFSFDFLPIKIEKHLLYSSNPGFFKTLTFSKMKEYYCKSSVDFKVIFFDRQVSYIRYLDFFLLGFVSSKFIVSSFKRKIKNFLRTNLHFELSESKFHAASERSIYFLGYNIRSIPVFINTPIFSVKKSFLLRLVIKMKLFSNRFLNKLNFDSFSSFRRIFLNKRFSFSSFEDKKLLTYIFQYESIRSLQIGKLLNFSLNSNVPSKRVSFLLKNNIFYKYQSYSFNLFITRIKLCVTQLSQFSSSFIIRSVTPLDITLKEILFQLNKNYLLYQENIFTSLDKTKMLYTFDLSCKKDLAIHSDNFFFDSLSKRPLKNSSLQFTFLISFDSCFKVLKFYGFIHFFKKRPISNARYLLFEDLYIIQSFGNLSYSILNWFRAVSNFHKVKFIIELVRQSCILTLCRKHNKGKNWSYGIYTPNLLVLRSLFNNKSFFPDRTSLTRMYSKFLISDYYSYYFNESFFFL
uniref:Maturase n=1 Tax=Euglenaformis proxima TaxID=299110 RepID=A0A023HHV8_9EUGL|nr:maturase [Euglenaformis proxima]AGL11985.2 maturase [Euglenaformis proxima]